LLCFARIVLISFQTFFRFFTEKKIRKTKDVAGEGKSCSHLKGIPPSKNLSIVFPVVREIEIDRYKQLLSALDIFSSSSSSSLTK
jgi:hypothetical protein